MARALMTPNIVISRTFAAYFLGLPLASGQMQENSRHFGDVRCTKLDGCSGEEKQFSQPSRPVFDSFDVESNCYRRPGHGVAVMRILLPFCKEIPDAGRHLASFG